MSDQDVSRVLDDLERLLGQDDLDPEAIASWKVRFDQAVAGAEQGPGWPALVQRAHHLQQQIEGALDRLVRDSLAIKQELGLQAQGTRALKAYKPT